MIKKIIHSLQQYSPLVFIITLCGFLFFIHPGRDQLSDWDECIYSQYAVEMKHSGNLLTNQWNNVLVFEKPPLNTWLTQIPYFFGVNEFTARIVPVVESLLLFMAIYIFAKKYFSGRVAVLSVLLGLSVQVLLAYSIRVNTDIGFTLFTFLGVFAWFESQKRPRLSYLAGLFFGLAVLNKGLSILPFLLALFISIFLAFNKKKLLNFIKLIEVFLITIIPWHAYHFLKYGYDFYHVYFLEHIVKRAQNPLDFHFESRLFYFKLIFSNLFPWIFGVLILPIYYLISLKKFLNKKKFFQELKEKQVVFTLMLLIILPLISITLVKTRIAWYAMPIYPFLAIFLSASLVFLINKFKFRPLIYILILLAFCDVFFSIAKETRYSDNVQTITPRNAIFMRASRYPQKVIEYLVWLPERQAKGALSQSPNLYTSTTFVYGGNPCAVYYSRKNVHYYYSVEEFKKRMSLRNGLYVVENGDLIKIDRSKIKIEYANRDFTLFKN